MRPKQWFTLSDGSPLTRQESFVLRQVAKGEIADLKQEFGEAETDRRLRARFLEELLTGELQKVEIHRRGVRISNAIIEEPVELENAEVSICVELLNSVFEESVNFRDISIKYLSLSGSRFLKEAVFHRMKVESAFFGQNIIFEGPADFGGAIIVGQFVAVKAKFLSENQDANFNGIQVGNDARFDDAEFYGGADFVGADIIGQLGANDAKFLAEDQVINFSRIRVGQSTYFEGTEFHGLVIFASADIRGQFVADGAKFLGKNQEANFNGMLVGQSAFFRGCDFQGLADLVLIKVDGNLHLNPLVKSGLLMATTFRGAVNFAGAIIGNQLRAQGTKFLAENQEAIFNGIQVDQDAIFNDADFHGPVDFVGADIKGQFQAQRAKFLSKNHKASFNSMQVGDAFLQGADFHGVVDFVLIKVAGNLYLDPLLKTGVELSTTFHSDVNFRGADIGGEFLADKAQFLGHISDFEAVKVGRSFHASGALFSGSVYFSEMQVESNFYINPFERMKSFKTLFKGAANFSDLEVHGVFNADQAIFQSESTIFSGIRVGQGAFFNGTIFFGGLVLKEGQLTDLVIRGLHRLSKGGLPLTEIVLNRTRIAHRLTIEDVETKRFHARNLEVKGPAELSRLFIRDEADMRDAALHHLQMVEIDWAAPVDGKEKVYLDGLAYESITTRKEPDKQEDWKKLFAWLSLSRFNTRNYGQLEDYLQRGGNKARADEAFIRGKRRAWRRRHWWSTGKWGLLLFWDWLAGYGRKPGRIFWVSMAIILIGAFTFEPHFQESTGWLAQLDGQHPWISRFLLSLNRFFPIVDLGMFNIWSPAPFSTFACIWYQVEKICGWILIPIGLAAVYTRLK